MNPAAHHTSAPSVLVTQPIHRSALAKLPDAGYAVEDLASQVPLTAQEIKGRLGSAQALVCHLTDRVDERVLSHPGLRAVATVSAGMDHIDLEAARRHRVRVVNTPDVLTEATERMSHLAVDGLLRALAEQPTSAE